MTDAEKAAKELAEKAAKEAADKAAADLLEAEKNREMVPLYKLKALKEKFDKALEELDAVKKSEAAKQEQSLIEQSKYKELADQKGAQVNTLEMQLKQIQGDYRQSTINSLIEKEVLKYNPRDVSIILPLINQKELEIIEENGKVISIKGLDKIMETFKKEKDFLFGVAPKHGEQAKTSENGKAGVGNLESLESEYRALLGKQGRSISENIRLRAVVDELAKLRSAPKT